MSDPLFGMGTDNQGRNYRYHYRKTIKYAVRQLRKKSATLGKACLAAFGVMFDAVGLARFFNKCFDRRDHATRN